MDSRIRKAAYFAFILGTYVTLQAADNAASLSDFADDQFIKDKVINITDGFTHSGDLSIFFLRLLFGSVSELSGNNHIIGEVFKLFNYGILGIVSFTIGYSVLTSVIGSAQDAAGALSSRVSPLTLVRTVAGVSIMTPMPGSGYSLVQTLVMKVVLFGIAFANTGWEATLSYMDQVGDRGMVVAADRDELQTANKTAAKQFFANNYLPIFSAYHMCRTKGGCDENADIISISDEGILTFSTISGGTFKAVNEKPTGAEAATIFKNVQLDEYKKIATRVDDTANYQLLIKPALKTQINILLNHAKSDYRSFEPARPLDAKNSIDLGKQKFDSIYSCPFTTTSSGTTYLECTTGATPLSDDAAAVGKKIEQLRKQVSRRVIAAGDTVAAIIDYYNMYSSSQPVARQADSWSDLASRSGWLSAGIYYRDLMKFNTTESSDEDDKLDGKVKLKIEYNSENAEFARPNVKIEIRSLAEILAEAAQAMQHSITFSDAGVSTTIIGNPYVQYQGIRASIEKYKANNRDGHEARNHLIPDVAGKVSHNVESSGWMYGVEAALPIRTLANMAIHTMDQLFGYKEGYGSLDNNKGEPQEDRVFQGSLLHTVLFPDKAVNPIVMIQSLGKRMMGESVTYFADTISGLYNQVEKLATGHFATSLTINLVSTAVETALHGSLAAPAAVVAATAAEIAVSALKLGYNGVKIATEIYVPLGTSVASALFAMGVVLGVYIPLLPFVLFLFGTVAWLMSVVEAMVAAPLVALGMTHPEGHDLLGKSEQALILLLGVFIRPIVMLFGMLMAIIVSQVLVKLFHLGFLMVTLDIFKSTGSADPLSTQAVVLCGVLLVYIYILMNIIEQSYSLIYVIPEKILRWIGGPQDQTGIGQLADQAKGESQQAAQQAGSGAAASTSGPSMDAPQIKFSAVGGGGGGDGGSASAKGSNEGGSGGSSDSAKGGGGGDGGGGPANDDGDTGGGSGGGSGSGGDVDGGGDGVSGGGPANGGGDGGGT